MVTGCLRVAALFSSDAVSTSAVQLVVSAVRFPVMTYERLRSRGMSCTLKILSCVCLSDLRSS